MVRKASPKLKPMRELNSRQQNERRLARKLGLGNEFRYRRWVKKHASLPESDPAYFRTSLRGNARVAEISRLKRISKSRVSPAKQLRRKMQYLVQESGKWSAFSFSDKYLEIIMRLLQSPETSEYDKKILRSMIQKLNSKIGTIPENMTPGKQGELF